MANSAIKLIDSEVARLTTLRDLEREKARTASDSAQLYEAKLAALRELRGKLSPADLENGLLPGGLFGVPESGTKPTQAVLAYVERHPGSIRRQILDNVSA